MDILDLRYFIAAYDTGSYARAADKLFVSRQALRQKLQRLEEEIGSPLFVYGTKKLAPTELGHNLYQDACSLVAQFESLEWNLQNHSQQKKQICVLLWDRASSQYSLTISCWIFNNYILKSCFILPTPQILISWPM